MSVYSCRLYRPLSGQQHRFYTRYAAMTVIHQRRPDLPSARKVAWLSDRTAAFRPGAGASDNQPIRRWDRSTISASPAPPRPRSMKVALATAGRCFTPGAGQLGDPVGYFAFFADPDGNTRELSWGQQVESEVIRRKTGE